MQPIPFAISTSAGRNKKANGETIVNLFASINPPTAKNKITLSHTPGALKILEVPQDIYGIHVMNDITYIVTATRLYKVVSDTAEEIGTLNFRGLLTVSMADNGTTLIITNGDSYVYSSDDETCELLEADGYYPADYVEYQDGYFIFNRRDTGQFFITGLYSTGIDALDYASAEGSQDNTNRVISNNRNLFIFGTHSIEAWYNSGNADFPFERIQGSFQKNGCISPNTINVANGNLMWVGEDNTVYIMSGYTPVRVSTDGIEYSISQDNNNMSATSYTEEGHTFYVLHLTNQSLVYDLSTQLWHTRETDSEAWAINGLTRDNSNRDIGFHEKAIYSISMDYPTHNGNTTRREITTAPVSSNGDFITVYKFLLDADQGLLLSHESDKISLSVSKDGGANFGEWRDISFNESGETRYRNEWRRLGRAKDFTFKIQIQTVSPVMIVGAYGEIG